MAIIHALLALSSFAVVLTAGTVQAQGLPPEGPVSGTFTATLIPPLKLADRWRQRVCRGDRMKRREFIALSIGGHGVGYALPTR
jgi:hypothetical protein